MPKEVNTETETKLDNTLISSISFALRSKEIELDHPAVGTLIGLAWDIDTSALKAECLAGKKSAFLTLEFISPFPENQLDRLKEIVSKVNQSEICLEDGKRWLRMVLTEPSKGVVYIQVITDFSPKDRGLYLELCMNRIEATISFIRLVRSSLPPK